MKTLAGLSRRTDGSRIAIQARFDGYSVTQLHSEVARLSPKFRDIVDDGCGRPLRVANLTRSDTLREIWAVLDAMPAGYPRDLAADLERLTGSSAGRLSVATLQGDQRARDYHIPVLCPRGDTGALAGERLSQVIYSKAVSFFERKE